MSDDPVVKAVAGLMTAHHTTQQAVVTLSRGLTSTNKAVTTLQTAVSALQESVEGMEASVVDLESSLANEGERIQALLEAVTAMAHNSTDTQKRLTALEADVEELKRKSA